MDSILEQIQEAQLPEQTVPPESKTFLPGSSVLLVDDDEQFCGLVTHLLQSHGYEVSAVKNAHEAFCNLSEGNPALIIVDCRLPGMDGITWISKLRTSGNNTPVILCTGAWLDKHTFSWLRNMLKVCLIIQKPIVPELFLQTIESVLPPSFTSYEATSENAGASTDSGACLNKSYEHLLKSNSQEAMSELDDLMAGTTDSALLSELGQLRRKMLTQQAINNARTSFLQQLPQIWDELVTALQLARSDFNDAPKLQAAMMVAHKVKGSSGTYGLEKLSKNCERIEELLKNVDPTCSTERDLIWSEVLRYVSEGTDLALPDTEEHAAAPVLDAPTLSLLVVGCAEEAVTNLVARSAHKANFVPQFAHSAAGALSRAREERFDAALIDISVDATTNHFDLERRIRSAPQNANLPICLISKQDMAPPAGARIYAGANATVELPCTEQSLGLALNSLHRSCLEQKCKILCVDDDELLTQFIESVLACAGYSARSLHEPSAILDAMREYEPDLVLLDVIMPGLSGYDVCRLLKSQEQFARVPVVFLTAKSDSRSRAGAFQAGGSDFLAKPILADELLLRVQTHLATNQTSSQGTHNDGVLLKRDLFKARASRLLKACSEGKRDCSLGIISISDYGNLDVDHGSYASEQVSSELGRLLSARMRAGDLRGQLEPDRFAILLPGENLKVMGEVWEALQQDCQTVWYADPTGVSFQSDLKFASAGLGIDGNSIDELLAMCVTQLRKPLANRL